MRPVDTSSGSGRQSYRDEGARGLGDRSRRPHRSPRRTSTEIEDIMRKPKNATGHRRKSFAWYLGHEKGLVLSPRTIRHILCRDGFTGEKTKPEPPPYP